MSATPSLPEHARFAGLLLVATVAVAVLVMRGSGGEPVAMLDLATGDARATVQLGGADLLRARADLEFRYRTTQLRRDPVGCQLTLTLSDATRARGESSCTLFPEVAVGASSSARWEADGRAWRRLEGQRLSCALPSPGPGTYTIRASSTLARCVPELVAARVELYR